MDVGCRVCRLDSSGSRQCLWRSFKHDNVLCGSIQGEVFFDQTSDYQVFLSYVEWSCLVSMIYRHTKFNNPTYSDSLFISVKLKVNNLCTFHIFNLYFWSYFLNFVLSDNLSPRKMQGPCLKCS